jgi:hypothetical protein
MAEYETNINRIESEVSGWRDTLEKLREKADKADARDKIELSKQLEHLRSLVEEVEKRMHEIRLAREGESDDQKERLGQMVQETRREFKSV